VNTGDFHPIERTAALSRLKLNASNKYICFVGGLAPWHGVEYLIQASNNILKEFPDVLFLIIGDGPMKGTIIQQIEKLDLSKKFILTGNVEHSLIPYFINACELCVAPFTGDRNLRIGLSPLKIYEYLSCGKAVVASDIPGVSDILLKSGGGMLVKPDNPLELQIAITTLLNDNEIRTRMGQMGQRYISSNHSWTNTAERIFKVFTDLSNMNDRSKYLKM
jgi:glycosyltransferase involved in cell wall biosynthesis